MLGENNISIKLIIIGIVWPPDTFLQRLIRGLIDAGIEVTVACDEKPSHEWLSHPNFRWLWTPTWNMSAPNRLWSLISLIFCGLLRAPKAVWQIINLRAESFNARLKTWYRLLPFVGHRWDVTYFPWNSAAIEYLTLSDMGTPVVVSCRGSQINVAPHDPNRQAVRQELSTNFQKAAAVHCVSEAIKMEATYCGLDPRKAWVIRPAVDPGFFHPGERLKSGNGIFNIISTGDLIWRKGSEYALLAVRNLLDQGIPAQFHIIGDGPEYSRLLYTIGDLNLDGKVLLHGRLAPLEVRNRLQEADAFLFSSLSEGIANAVLEAMACGLPVVTTDCGGMTEAVTDGVEGLVVPVRDPEAMAGALARLATDPALSSRLGQAARQRILKDFSLDRQVAKFIEMYLHVLEKD